MTRLPNTNVSKTFNDHFQYLQQDGSLITTHVDDYVGKIFTANTQSKYYLKINRLNRLFNPHDKDFLEESLYKARIDKCDPFRVVEVNKATWQYYISFLKTKDKSFLVAAEKEI